MYAVGSPGDGRLGGPPAAVHKAADGKGHYQLAHGAGDGPVAWQEKLQLAPRCCLMTGLLFTGAAALAGLGVITSGPKLVRQAHELRWGSDLLGSAAAQLERAARAAAEAETAAKVAAEKQRRECIFASLRQQVLCCSQFSIGCPNGSRGEGPPFDCDLHAADPTRLWSPAKKEWCCLHVGRACAGDAAVAAPAEASCDLAGGASPSEWPAGRREHCCRTAGVGCARGAAAAATELDFDCEAGHSKWATGWSAEKKAFCCEREQKGCEGPMRTSTTTTASTPALPSNALGMGSTFATGAAAGRRGVIGAAAANAATKPSTTALPAAAAMNGTSSAAATKRRRPAIGVAAASTATDAASAAAPATSATSATTLRATTASRTTTTAATATTSTGEAPRPRTVARTTAAAPRGPAPAPVPPAAPGGRRLSFADVEFSNLGGQGPDGAGASSGRRGIRYRSVTQVGGRGVDLVLDAIGGYAPAAWDVGANGRRGSLGMVTFSCGTRADLGLGLFEAGTNRSAVVPNFYLSLVHVRHSGLARRGEVSVKGPSNWYLSASTRVEYETDHPLVLFVSRGAEDSAAASSVERLTAEQRSRAVTVVYRRASSVRFAFQSLGPVEEGCSHALLLGGWIGDPDFRALS